MTRIALNGLGRIGKLVLRDLIDTGAAGEIVLLNDPVGDAEQHALLMEFDSVHGRWRTLVAAGDGALVLNGQTIRLNFPAPTEERRKQLAKEVSKLGEEAKVAVRNIRREAMDKAKAMKKAGELTEDSQKTMEEDVQKLTDKYIKNIDAAVEEKQKEIMAV